MRSRVSEFCISLMMQYVNAPCLFSAMLITHATTDEGALKYYVFICDLKILFVLRTRGTMAASDLDYGVL